MKISKILKLLICNALSSTHYSLPIPSTSFAVLFSALTHCRIFFKSTATREWITCILDILQFRKTFFYEKKRRWNRETKVLNGYTKRQHRQCEKLPLKAPHSATCRRKNFPREYFLAADRGDVHIIKGHKNLIAFMSLLLIQKQGIQKMIFLKKVCLGVGFPSKVSSSRESGKCECPVMHQWANIVQTKIMQICGSSCYKVSKSQKCSFHFWQLFIWKVFVKSKNNTMWSVCLYFNQQTRTVSVFRIYHIEMPVTNIC